MNGKHMYIRLLKDVEYTKTPEHQDMNFVVKAGEVLIAAVKQPDSSDDHKFVFALAANPNEIYNGLSLHLSSGYTDPEDNQFEILGAVPSYAEFCEMRALIGNLGCELAAVCDARDNLAKQLSQ
jgi:hypothetical protein